MLGGRSAIVILGAAAVIFLASGDTCGGGDPTQGNATTYCDHGNRIYDDQSGHGLAVAAHDPTCPQPAAARAQ